MVTRVSEENGSQTGKTPEEESHKMARHPIVHSLRLVASFALLGAVTAGVLFGWQAYGDEARLIGALAGGVGAAGFKLRYLI